MEEKNKITLIYKNGFTGQDITMTKEYYDDSLGHMETLVEFFKTSALFIGFSEETVNQYIGAL